MQQGITKGLGSKRWSDARWLELLEQLVADDMLSWKDVAALTLGHLNPLQVGTSLASNKTMQEAHGKGETLRAVMGWLYEQSGRCNACGTRLELQVDHNVEETTDLNLMSLLCRRDNVIRRHALGGVTDLTTESALMWILLTLRPRTFDDFVRLCRLEGLTVSNIRFQEAWAMAVWLARESPSRYDIEDEGGFFSVWQWNDNALTRLRSDDPAPTQGKPVASGLSAEDTVALVVHVGDGKCRMLQDSVRTLPFATYDISPRPVQEVALTYASGSKLILPRPPRHCDLKALEVVPTGETVEVFYEDGRGREKSFDATGVRKKTFTPGSPASVGIRVST